MDGKKPRFLCLHGFRTSGEIMKTQLMAKWPESVTSRLDLVFPDAPFPCGGKSEVEGIFPPPYFEWYQYNKEFTEYKNLDVCYEFIQDLVIKHGPIDGLLGFSQGGILSASLPGLQAKGHALTKVPKVKYVVIMSGAKFRGDMAEKAYSEKNTCPSLHFVGEMDFLKKQSESLVESYVNPLVIYHPKGHTVPRLSDEKSLDVVDTFLNTIEDVERVTVPPVAEVDYDNQITI
ncbi:Serine hydrolase family protein [Zostera marina]|uniref:Serine hydrolase family protein n=1 Tax=Zostera marina TaxID=29655 RepID=A0A0K9P690_ZOSMR|nr:Serine hydrolase family protein [Zostera marina]